jgi:hypothetical protein
VRSFVHISCALINERFLCLVHADGCRTQCTTQREREREREKVIFRRNGKHEEESRGPEWYDIQHGTCLIERDERERERRENDYEEEERK